MIEINADMEAIIKQAILSFVATVNEDGTPNLFRRVFIDRMGMTPGQWRRLAREGEYRSPRLTIRTKTNRVRVIYRQKPGDKKTPTLFVFVLRRLLNLLNGLT